MTLPEAAVLLGTSVESVRRRIKAGKLDAFHDAGGRLRIRTSLPPESEPVNASSRLSVVWNELQTSRQDLTAALSRLRQQDKELELSQLKTLEAQQEARIRQVEAQELRDELTAARQALDYSREQLSSLWGVVSSRQKAAGSGLVGMTDGPEAFDLAMGRDSLIAERTKIKGQIDRVRDLSRKRRWPWPQAS